MPALNFTLKSGRVLLLNKPFTPQELAEANTPEGMALLEALADSMELRSATVLTPQDPEYQELLRKHQVKPTQ